MSARELLAELEGRGVELWAEGEKLRLSAPKGLLTPALQDRLRELKGELVSLLAERTSAGTGDGEAAPVSFAQERLLVHERLIAAPIYNLGGALRLRASAGFGPGTGGLDVAVLERALAEIVRRHQILRTTFHEEGGHFRQHVGPPQVTLARADLRAAADPEAALAELLARESERPFDTCRDPLLRPLLAVLEGEPEAPRHAVLILTMHHLVSDAWSVGIFENELATLYAAFRSGQGSPLPALPWQYADFARWQRELESSGALAGQLAYWEGQLRGLEPIRLPQDRPRPATPSFRAGLLRLDLGLELSAAIADLARRQAATPFMVLLAGLGITLAVYSGRRRLAIGSPIANRHRRELEPLIGFFVNTQALCFDLGGRPDFLGLLEHTRRVCLDAHAHQDLPFEHLVEKLRPERTSGGGNPFFPAIFAFQNVPREEARLAGLDIAPVELESGRLRLDLELYLTDVGEAGAPRYAGHALFAEDLFERPTVERLAATWRLLLEGALADPRAEVFALPRLPAADESLLFGPWRGLRRDFADDDTIYRRFRQVALAKPEAIALQSLRGDQILTLGYGELARRADRLARRLQDAGIAPEEPIAVQIERSFELIVALLGVLGAGGAYLALEVDAPAERRRLLVRDAGVRFLVAASAGHAAAAELAEAEGLTLVEVDRENPAQPDDAVLPLPPVGLSSLAYVAYTSGSTGLPKGAAIPQRGVLRLVDRPIFLDKPGEETGILADDVFLQLAPVAFDASTLEIWGPLLHGARLALAPPGAPSLDGLAALLDRHRVSVLWLTAGLFHSMVDHRPDALRRLRRLLAGGDVLSPERCRRLLDPASTPPGFRLIDGYGPTENTTFTCCHVLGPGDDPGTALPVGRPIDDTEIFVLDAESRPVPIGVEGELYTGGGGLARGYLGRPATTAEKFVPHPFSPEPGARLYRSGDRVRFRADGSLDFLGRVDFQVKVRGFRVEPGELAAVLENCAGVRRAAVVARPVEEPGGERSARLDAYLVLDPDAAAAAAPAQASVAAWRELYDESYAQAAGPLDFELVGWNSSYTGEPLGHEEMVEWVDATVARIARWRPRRVLEIGCGTGLLLARLAPETERYVAADFSPAALAHVARLAADRGLAGLELVEATADRVAALFEPGSFDTVILNSVSQYFPSAEYLLRVLDGALGVLGDGGRLFVGDVRNLRRLPAFHSSLLLHRASGGETPAAFLADLERALAAERELLIDPELFRALAGRDPRVSSVLVQPKRGRHTNELTLFRFDATVEVGRREMPAACEEVAAAALETLRARLAGERRAFVARGLRDARVAGEYAFEQAAEGWRQRPRLSLAELRPELAALAGGAIDPEALARLGEEYGWVVELRLEAEHGRLFGAAFWPAEQAGAAAAARRAAADAGTEQRAESPWSSWVLQPIAPAAAEALIAGLRAELAVRLPSYLLPGTLTVLARLPLNANGKVDSRALPEPLDPGQSVAGGRAPESALEKRLAGIWLELLRPAGGEMPGLDQDFFELGGHSLLATRLVARIREELGLELPLRQIFATPTLGALATAIAELAPAGHAGAAGPAAPHATEGPLALAQRRLWVLHRLEGGAAYHVPLAARLDGPLDAAALERALAVIVERHAALRTAFVEVDGEPRQRLVEVALELPVETLADEGKLATALRAEAARPFDLARPPLLRARLFALGPDRHVLTCVFHHLVADGWSLAIFLEELALAYDAARGGRRADLPALPWRYLDHSLWQEKELAPRLPGQLAIWRKRLAGAPLVLDLPTDRARPARQLFRGEAVGLRLEAPLLRRLEALAFAANASLFMVLLAIFGAVLALRGGGRDLLIGAPVAGRTRRELEPLIGLFVNTLVLRVELAGDPSFRELLARVRAMVLEALENQDLPFERLVEELRPERDVSRNPVVQVLLTLHNEAPAHAALDEVAITPLELDGGTVKVDLDLAFRPCASAEGEALDGRLRFDRDLFTAESARRLADHFQLLAATFADDLELRLRAWPRATAAERAAIAAVHPPWLAPPELATPAWIAAHRAASPGAGPIVDRTEELSWTEVEALSLAVAHGLRRRGLRPGDRVAVLVARSARLPALLLGIWRAGAAWVPLDPIFPAERRESACADAGVALVVSDGVAAAPAAHRVVAAAELFAAAIDRAEGPLPEVHPDQLAYVLFTSGSTGRPKGVAVPHRAVVAFLEAFAFCPGLDAADTLLAITTLSFDIAVLELFLPLAVGARLVIAERDETADAEKLARRIDESGTTVLQATPTTWRLLAGIGWRNPGRARVLCGGEALPADLAGWLLASSPEVWNVYGPTEATVWATVARVDSADAAPPVGRPIPGTRAVVVDRDGAALGIGAVGELLLGGAGLAHGYVGRPGQTAERFVPDPQGRGQRLYRTGDLARWRDDGQLQVLGRRDHQVKVRGFRVELGEIEAALEDLPAILQAALIVEGGAEDPRLVAFAVPAPGGEAPAEAEVLAPLRRRLPAYMVPAELRWLPALPTTANGKVDRRALTVLEGRRARAKGVAEPANETESRLLGLWREVLGDEGPLGVDHDFFAAGGHSLSAIRLVTVIEKRLGAKIPLAALFEAPTPRALALRLGRTEDASGLLPLARRHSGSAGVGLTTGGALALVPGVAGNPIYLRPLAERLERPCWGLEAAGVDGEGEALEEVERMAARHLEALARRGVEDDLLLGGHSFGAKIAFESARQALNAGRRVAALVIFDTPAPTAANGRLGVGWDEFAWLAEAATQIQAWQGVGAASFDAAELRLLGEKAYDHVGATLGDSWQSRAGARGRLHGMVAVCLASQRRPYVPAVSLPVPIHLFVAETRPRVEEPLLAAQLAEPDLGWGAFSSAGVTVENVPGDHVSMFATPVVEVLAERLRAALAKY